MKGAAAASGRDLRALARIVTDDRGEPPAEGLAPSLLSDLIPLIDCDSLVFRARQSQSADWFGQTVPSEADDPDFDVSSFRAHYWSSPCSYPEHSGDLRSLVRIPDFYSARQWHSTGMYQDCCRPYGIEHELMLCLPASLGWTAGPGRTLRLVFLAGPAQISPAVDSDLLTVLRPHLHRAHLDAERRRHPTPQLTPRQQELLDQSPPGTPTPRSPAAWAYPRQPSAPTWKTSTPCCRSPAGPPPSTAPSPTGPPTPPHPRPWAAAPGRVEPGCPGSLRVAKRPAAG